MKTMKINAYEEASIIEEYPPLAFAKVVDNYGFTMWDILKGYTDERGERAYMATPGRPGLYEPFQGAAKVPRPKAEMELLWEETKQKIRDAAAAKAKADLAAIQKEKAAALLVAKKREAKAMLRNSHEELKTLLSEDRGVDKLCDNKRAGTLLQRISASEYIINTL